ncbi:MAG TPA: ABC transporter permease [Candidatus Limnocylindrales bacterium]|nr:ABC transporter permease [Candidatus Limnocylindrales bacterium]
MHNTWLIIRREYLERIRSKAFIIMTLLMPVFMASTILIPAMLSDMKSGGTRRIVLVANNPEIAEAVKQQLMAPQQQTSETTDAKSDHVRSSEKVTAPRYAIDVSTTATDAERTSLRQQITDGKIDGFLWLTDNDLANRKVVYNARDVTDFGESIELRNAVQSAVVKRQLAQKGMSGVEVETLLKPIDLDSIRIEKGKEGASGISVFLVSFTMVMLLYVNVLVYGVAVMRSIIEEKSSRILEVLLSTVTAKQLLAGKIIGVGAVGLTQIIIWVAVAGAFSVPGLMASRSMLSNIHIPMAGVIAFGVFFILGYFLYSTMYAALGAMVNSDQEAQQVQWPAMLPIIFSIVLSTPVLQHPNSPLAFWTSMVPFFAPILMFVRVMVETPPMWQIVLCIALMLLTTWGMLSLSSRIYRVGILMYGKRPTLPELRRWLKYSG